MENKAISPITAQIIEFPSKSLFGCQNDLKIME
jgi:hypothetical protein